MKLPGSFRLGAGSRHLYRHCIFTGLLAETVPQSFRYSCAWELTPQGISLLLDSSVLFIAQAVAPVLLIVAYEIGLYLSTTNNSGSDV